MIDVEKQIDDVIDFVEDLIRESIDAYSVQSGIAVRATMREKLRTLLSSAQSGERESLRECAMCDLSHANGMLAGWNFCIADDESGFQNARRSRVTGAVAVLKALRGKHHTQAQSGEQVPYAVLTREIGESGFFDHKPVKPGSVHHLHANKDPHYDCVELYTHPAPASALEVERDAARWRETLKHIGGASCQLYGKPEFVIRYLPPAGNLMQGSVAEHFTKSIDVAIAASQPNGEV